MWPSPAIPIEPADSWGPTTSVVMVFLVGWLVTAPLLFALWRYFVHRGRSMRAESAAKDNHAPDIGPALLSGKVETDDGSPAIRVEIQQTGREWSNKGNWSHEWKEVGRTVRAQPFRLRLADGTALRVDPDDRVRLVDTLETESFEWASRRRVAELENGERVWVSGEIAEEGARGAKTTAYRTGPGALVLRGSRFEPMEIASGALDSQFSYWRGFYARAAAVLGAIFFLVHTVLFGHFYAELWLGKVESATFTTTTTYTTSSKSGPVHHYVVHARLPAAYGGRVVSDEVSSSLYDQANRRELPKVPFMVVPAVPMIHSIGSYPDVGIFTSILAIVAGVLTPIVFFSVRSGAMPWYEQRRVIERGPGQLDSKAWYAQVPGKRGLFVPRIPKPRK